MFLLFLLSFILASAMTIPLTASPLILGIWILIMSSMFSAFICLTMSSWMGMITILVYIGGLNVLFAYFIATMPNQHLFSKPLLLSSSLIFLSLYLNFKLFPPTLNSIMQTNLLITKLLMNLDSLIFLLLAFILFLALIAVVKIASRHNGPLRPFMLS